MDVVLAQEQETPDEFSYHRASLRTVLDDLRQRTGYRVLYRDALVAGVTVTVESDSADVFSALRSAVAKRGIQLELDHARNRLLLAPAPDTTRAIRSVTAYVVDGQSGERLPKATVVWHGDEGRRRGEVTDANGRAPLRLRPSELPDPVTLVASHVGYQSASVTLSPSRLPSELPFRLSPRSATGPDVTVRTTAFPTALDTTWRGLTQPELFSPLGEPNVLRALQPLPSVAVTSALSGGMHVRGSQADAFSVHVDGMPIYNQSHLFGLFDAFNDDALQTIGFFADVAPAQYRAPPGGTLSLQTRAGAQTASGGTVELSNTALSATVDGPLDDGRGSWLLSARRSYLDAVSWFGNDELVARGVGRTSRPASGSAREVPSFGEEEGGEPSASFYDVHGTVQYEWPSGSQFKLSGYAGGDETAKPLDGFVRIGDIGDGERIPELERPKAKNQWGNEAASVQFEAPFRAELFSHTSLSLSRYHAQWQQASPFFAPPQESPAPKGFDLQNELVDATLKQQIDGSLGSDAWTLGAMSRLVTVRYRVQGPDGGLRHRQRAVQGDLFGQYDTRVAEGRVDIHLGLRLHGFSPGPYGRMSPRIWIEGWPDRPVSVMAGYTRNHQFLHRLSAARDTRVDTWIMSPDARPPAGADHGTLGVEVRPSRRWTVQVEGYYKAQRRVRLTAPIKGDGLFPQRVRPWARGRIWARGLEVLHRLSGNGWQWTASYALSRADIRVGRSPEGQRPAFWDRRHQGATRFRLGANEGWSGHLTWLVTSGRPNLLHEALPNEPERLAPYHRLDAALQYRRRVAGMTVEARAAVFNVYDRDNPRYRRPIGIAEVDGPRDGTQPTFSGVPVYDLGLQSSFRLSVTW